MLTVHLRYCYGPDGEETAVRTYQSQQETASSTLSSPALASATTTSAPQTTAVTDCHLHDTAIVCVAGNSAEVLVSAPGTPTGEPPAQYTGCHGHGDENFCLGPDGEEVQILPEGTVLPPENQENGESGQGASVSQGTNCHFHAGVEHCVGPGESESASNTSCDRNVHEYNIPIRIGTLFVMLTTSMIGVFAPILLGRFLKGRVNSIGFTVVKQFGTGVIVATALIHLLTHAELMFNNECIGTITYESTATAVAMAGVFLSFLVEYIGMRIVMHRLPPSANVQSEERTTAADAASHGKGDGLGLADLGHHHGLSLENSKLSVLVMEAGIIFHSILIGVTLVVAGDSFYITLFIVVVFHQAFEGLALGARIAALPDTSTPFFPMKLVMALAFALVTPVGMAIGLGVLQNFNGNDANTLVAMGTLDALSAGILLWVGIVDMWARDWVLPGGSLSNSGIVKTLTGAGALICGMVLMGVLETSNKFLETTSTLQEAV
ncbi:hypothetical protein EPUS_07990 [Endocarpon pusillum Z07020]|uniref:Zinc-regulated transporter 1 n=1 Tax=Endocarpon pusillum (strain Z07020 / HMAS-L-300199) TaxID=1263415 RepID=U1I0R5_ENDPU|nr:uncharacterized protein EPUS_07990 [Endocarpon pusillum Z07020]ERF76810.1 hypothetical protein EPUS_07990 [Endocarpon pusillum Z07020]